MARLHLTLLGGFQLRVDQRTIPVAAKKAQALLAYLALRPDRPHSRETLVGLLWGEAREERARHNLRQTMFRLRQAFARARNTGLVARGDTIALDTATVSVDVLEFQRLLDAGTVPGLEAAVALYQGVLLEGMHVAEPSFEEWLQPERERLRDCAVQALAKLLGYQTKRGAVDAAVQTAMRLLALDPLHESNHRALMRLYARQGRRASALRQYQLCVGVLQRELGVEPEAETRQVYQEILQQKARPIVTPEPPIAARPRPQQGTPHARRDVPGLEPPVVGRQMELARLHEALDEAWRRGGRTAVILGEAGIGKTRLLEEVRASALRRGGRVLSSRCYETEQILPFGPWVHALRAGLEEQGHDVLKGLEPLSKADLARLLPELAEPDREQSRPADDYLRLFAAVARLIEVLAAASPLVLIVEDLHWADEMSVRLFGFLARRVEAWPCLLATSVRVEDLGETPLLRPLLAELREQRHAASVTLAPLSKEETHRLVVVLARAGANEATLDGVAEQAWTLSKGNPFVVVETMRALHEGHRFEASTIVLPGRVRDAISSRLERLSPRAREILSVAAVIGREFEFKLLHHAGRLDEREVAEGIEELVRRGVLHGVGTRLDFAHDRVREVTYDQVLAPRRAQLHASVGRAIEAVYADELEPHHGALGAHFRQGEAWEKALCYLRQAGASALACAAHREALAYFEQASEVLEHLPEGRSRAKQAYDLGMYRATVLYSQGELRRIVGHLGEADAIARTLDDPLRRGRVDLVRLACLAPMGDQTAALESGERCLAAAEATGSVSLRANTTLMLGFAHTGLGDFRRATAYLRMSAAAVQDQSPHRRLGLVAPPAVLWRAWIMLPLAELGDFREAIPLAEEASQIVGETAQPYGQVVIRGTLGHLYCVRGTPALGIPALERSVALCRDYEIALLSPLTFASLGHAYAMSGRLSEALPLMEQAVARGESLDIMWWQSRRLVQLGEGYLLAGRADEARPVVERGLALADAHGERGNRAYALRAFADVILRRDHPDLAEAEHHLHQALDLTEELGMRPLAARCQLDIGRVYRRAGDESRARELLTAAGERLREMEMHSWAEQANAEVAATASTPCP